MNEFVVAGKYGFLTVGMVELGETEGIGATERPSKDVRDAHRFGTKEEAVAHRFDVTDGKVLQIILG